MEHPIANNILSLQKPKNALPLIIDSPHSGRSYPKDFNYYCDKHELEKIEDRFVDELFENAPEYGATLLSTNTPRSYIDTNRAADDIDPLILNAPWPIEKYGEITPSQRTHAGLGLIYRLVKPGIPIYDRHLSAEEIMNRVKNHYEPYHDTLCTLIEDAYYSFGKVWHINAHSMPSSSAYPKKNITLAGQKQKQSDIVLGDRDGKTCTREFTHFLRDYWKQQGFHVTINDPFKGVELIEKYSQPTRGKNSIQIEINRALYMNEETGKKSKDFEVIKGHCTDMIHQCAAYIDDNLKQVAAD